MSATTHRQQTEQHRFDAGLRDMLEAGQGAMTLIVLTASTSIALVVDAVNDEAGARAVLNAADQLLRRIHRRSRRNALPCLLCDDYTLWRGEPPGAIAMLLPYGGQAVRTAIGTVICSHCADERSRSELLHAAMSRFRDGWLPDLRVLPPMAEAGHA